MIGSALRSFARLLGVSDEHAEDALHSERAAMQVTRRGFFGVVGAMAGESVFSFGAADALDGYEWRLAYGGALHVSRSGSTLVTFDRLLKERYTPENVSALVWKEHPPFFWSEPLLTMLEKPDTSAAARVMNDIKRAQYGADAE